MTTLTDTQVITASGGLVELGYSQITSPVQPTTTLGTPNIGLSATVVCDGGPVLVEVFSSAARGPIGTAGSNLSIRLLQNGVSVADQWGAILSSGTNDPAKPIHLAYRCTPSAGSHTFSVQAATSTGTGYFGAGTGTGASPQAPAFLRVSKIVQATQWPAVTTGTVTCTSTSRPSSPIVGQQIYEADTARLLLWTGSAWQQDYPTGSIVQVVTVRSDARATYASNNSGNGTTVSALGLTITPRFSNSIILCDWMINGELHQDNVFLIHKDGALASDGYNLVSGNNRWAGMMSGFYDQNEDSTPSNWNFKYIDSSLGNTNSRTYAPAVRSSGGSNFTFALNGTINSAAQDAYERMSSIGVAYEIRQ